MDITRLTVVLEKPYSDALNRKAREEMRTPQQQASYLLRQALGNAEPQQSKSIDHTKSGTTVRQDITGATLS